MWPWSTIKSLRLELEIAEESNTTLHGVLARKNADIRSLNGQIAGLNASIRRMGADRKQLDSIRVQQTEVIEQYVRNKKELHRTLDQRDVMVRALAAERDEAVLRARNVATECELNWSRYDTVRKSCNALTAQLQGAMVRDPKTGRLTKWVDPSTQVGVLREGLLETDYGWKTVSVSMGEPK